MMFYSEPYVYLSHKQAEQARREDHLCAVPYPQFGLFRYSATTAQLAGKRGANLSVSHIVYHCGVGPARYPLSLPDYTGWLAQADASRKRRDRALGTAGSTARA